jgi:serine protease Do
MIFKIRSKEVELATVELGVAREVAAAEEVVVIGNPDLGDFVLEKSAHNGSIASVRQSVGNFVKRPHLQINTDVAPGFSGGPVFNLRGEVIGVIDQMASLPRTDFAIPMEVVAEFLGVPIR